MENHKPVLTKEVLEYLAPQSNENFIDGTVGQGGHARLILQKNAPAGKVLGMDLDAGQIEQAKVALVEVSGRILLVNSSYADIKEVANKNNLAPVNGILLDLGYSSWHVDNSGKGFSFQKDEKLDMRYGQGELTAEKIVNEYPEKELEKIIAEYGEEKYAGKIARQIMQERRVRKIESTFQLKKIIESAVPKSYLHSRIHCATRTFQALRIAVNDELRSLQKVLPEAVSLLASGGRLVVISFHSLEDRIVKNFFRGQEESGIVKMLTKKPVMAEDSEVAENPRARSAKLRAFVKI